MGINNVHGPDADFMAAQDHHIPQVERQTRSAELSNLDALKARVIADSADKPSAKTPNQVNTEVQQPRVDKNIAAGANDFNQRFGPTDIRQNLPVTPPLATPALAPGATATSAATALPAPSTVPAASFAVTSGVVATSSTASATNALPTMAVNPNNAPPPVVALSAAKLQSLLAMLTSYAGKARANLGSGKTKKSDKDSADEASGDDAEASVGARLFRMVKRLAGF